jgi:large subunit ribosomal protein L21
MVRAVELRHAGYPPTGRAPAVQEGHVFAIIQSGGRQLKVTPGTIVTIDRVDVEPGEQVSIDQVLFVGGNDGTMHAGTPFVANARVVGVIAGESRGPKIRVFKKKRRKTMRKTIGHRSTYTRVEIKGIEI